ncbi:DUF1642 domain-containing protein [Streptococcus minor]|uniref:DUF1642 domain-containing protein n=1 Tax=Streptococcus minor TaxID=229549 RepID=A0A3P1V810_9STRE|nr:DUF1642 domain-containing protein [Streptococcus minor]RRD29495.1 DUF1642 domain-containing protein [Streptococcus minor]
MNKQQAIEELRAQSWEYENNYFQYESVIDLKDAQEIVSQINEPAKVVVPKHIDEKIRYCKQAEGYGLFHAMDYCYQYKDSADWLESNEELFARAWLDGYEVKQEQLYTVEIPNPNGNSLTVLEFISDSCIVLTQVESFPDNWKEMDIYHLTESEIKQDFEWAWQWAKPVEVE